MFEKVLTALDFQWIPLILFGHDGKTITDEGFDFILLHAEFVVSKYRLNKPKPTLEAFINNLIHVHEADKHVHI